MLFVMLTYSLHIVFGLLLCGLCQAFLEDCPQPCIQGGQKYCHPIPCPLPPCNNSVTPPGACCPECPKPECPHPCIQGGKKYCHPIPCPKPPCDNPVTPVGACCAECTKRTTSVLKDCPHPCTYNGHKFCEPIPCPAPPPNCTHPFTPPGGCCEICQDGTTSVLKDCPHPCTYNGHKFCEPIPCPPPPSNCTHPFIPPGGCCEICQDDVTTIMPVVTTNNCPHPCEQGGRHFCHPIPCPHPPCADPVTPKGACCATCPNGITGVLKDCPHPCTYNGHKFCEPIPCPPPPPNCTHPFTPPGGCCEICQDDVTTIMPVVTTNNCPHPCEQGGRHFCHPIPCPHPPCADPVTPKGACCATCPNGPNCRIEGHIYPAFQDTVRDGKLCRCFGLSGKCDDILAS